MMTDQHAKNNEAQKVIAREYNRILKNTGTMKQKRIMLGVPMTGLIRAEWALARYGQVIPCNWSQVDSLQWIDQYTPLEFLVADARNIIVHNCLVNDFEWLLQIDSDVILPHDTFLRINEYMIEGTVPMLSGLYFTKSVPSEPLIYRGRGTGYYADWKFGDRVWVDGIPSGITLIHNSILRTLADMSKEYEVMPGLKIKAVYDTPGKTWYDPEARNWYAMSGTEDLSLCSKIIEEGIFKKAGWPDYDGLEFPFLLDTNIFGRHVDNDGKQYPSQGEENRFKKEGDDGKKEVLFNSFSGSAADTFRLRDSQRR